MKHFDPSRAWDHHITSSGLDDLENTKEEVIMDNINEHCNFVSCGFETLESEGYELDFWHQEEVDFALELALDNPGVLAGAICPHEIVFEDRDWVIPIISPLPI